MLREIMERMFADAGVVDPGQTLMESLHQTETWMLLDFFLNASGDLMEREQDVDLSESYFDLTEYIDDKDE